jgi:hypothetical protein
MAILWMLGAIFTFIKLLGDGTNFLGALFMSLGFWPVVLLAYKILPEVSDEEMKKWK